MTWLQLDLAWNQFPVDFQCPNFKKVLVRDPEIITVISFSLEQSTKTWNTIFDEFLKTKSQMKSSLLDNWFLLKVDVLMNILSKTVPPTIYVPNQLGGAPFGTSVTLECYVEAFPQSINFWLNSKGKIPENGFRTPSV